MHSFIAHYGFTPHIILDSRFSEKSFLDWVEITKSGATIAIPSTHMSSLFSLLSQGVGPNQWRAAFLSSGRVASFKRVLSSTNEIIEWRILSYGWKVENVEVKNDDSFTLSDFELLSKLSPKGLITIARLMGEIGEGDNLTMAAAITKISPEQRMEQSLAASSSTKYATKCLACTKEKTCDECTKRHNQLRDKTYVWKREELEKMKGKDLNLICDTLQLKKTGLRKTQKIEKILLACDSEACEAVKRRVASFIKQPRTDSAPLHKFYKENFNVIDKANQVKFSTSMPGRWKSEYARMIHGVIKLSFTNLFTILQYDQNNLNKTKIREAVALSLLTT